MIIYRMLKKWERITLINMYNGNMYRSDELADLLRTKGYDVSNQRIRHALRLLIEKGFVEKWDRIYTITEDGKIFIRRYWFEEVLRE